MALLVYGFIAFAVPPIEKMDSGTVLILSPCSSGSGFLLNQGRQVATNWHVAEKCVFEGNLMVFHKNGQKSLGSYLGHDKNKDLTILKLKTLFTGNIAPLVPSNLVKKGDEVWVYGYPAAAFGLAADITELEPTITKGIISRILNSIKKVKIFQIDAPINPGNSGGPVFNELGGIIGIATSKSLTGEGIGWAVSAEELMEELDKLGIPYDVANTRPEPGLVGSVTVDERTSTWIAVGAVVLSMIAMLIAFTKQGRTIIKEVVTRTARTSTPPLPPPLPEKKATVPELIGLTGSYSGVHLELDKQPLVLGRDPRVSQLVFPEDAKVISKRHCILTYDQDNKGLWINDCWSTNGTYVKKTKLSPGQSKLLLSGGSFHLANNQEKFMFSLGPKDIK